MKELSGIAQQPSSAALDEVLTNGSTVQQVCEKYLAFREKVKKGEQGKTAQFWVQYMDKVWLVLTYLRATKENNLDLHMACLEYMCPFYFAMDHHNYARYLSVYYITLLNLDVTHPGATDLLRNGGLSVSRSDVPASRNPVDLTIEQTINRHAKSNGGIIGFSRNYSAYYRWCVTRHARASYVAATLQMADMEDSDEYSHKSTRPSEIKQNEKEVQKLCTAFRNFINPFEVEIKDSLFSLSSGAKAPAGVEKDLLQVDEIGKKAFKAFVQERFVDKSVPFHAPIKRNKLKTMKKTEVTKVIKSSYNKALAVSAQRNVFAQMLVLSQENNISLEKALSYPLNPVPWALATPDGLPAKTDKARLLHKLEQDAAQSFPQSRTGKAHVIDGNAVLHSMTSLPLNFGELASSVFNMLPNASRVDFVTDTYYNNSIKSVERKRRGTGDVFLVKGPSTRIPKEWKAFLQNNTNKENLIGLILSEWQKDAYASRLKNRQVLFVYKETCYSLTSDGHTVQTEQIEELSSSQEEADGRIILHCLHIAHMQPNSDIVVRSPDTDVFILLLHYNEMITSKVYFDTGTGDKRRLLNVDAIINCHGEDLPKYIVGLHAMTGCDTTSAFVRKGKIKPLNIVKKQNKFLAAFTELGKDENVTEEVRSMLEQFVCSLYGKQSTDINKLRYEKAQQKFTSTKLLSETEGTDMSLLPPCQSALNMHIKRANYQSYVWKRSHEQFPEFPMAIHHGWCRDQENDLDYNWCDGQFLPQV